MSLSREEGNGEKLPRLVCGLFAIPAMFALFGCGGSDGSGGAVTLEATFHEFSVPVVGNVPSDPTRSGWPDDLVGDDLGNIWFAQYRSNEIGRMTPDGQYTGFPVPTANSNMDSIAIDLSHRTIWVSQVTGNQIVRLNMDTGAVMEIPVPTANVKPGDLAVANDGTVWFTEGYDVGASGQIARLDPTTNTVTEVRMPGPRRSFDGMTIDPSGGVWFVELDDNRIGRYSEGTITEFDLPRPNVSPTNIGSDKSGRIWVDEQSGNALAILDPATGGWGEVPIPTSACRPTGLALDDDDNVWFTELGANKIGVLPSGSSTIVDFPIPTLGSGPEDIRPIAGAIYFTERYGNKIGQISVPGLTRR